jgi:RNA polymerase sigma-54 factor
MMTLRQEVRMRQDLVQTPQQILRSELLQLPMQLMEARLKLEVEQNPVLEFDEFECDVQDREEPGEESESKDESDEVNEVSEEEQLTDEDNWEEFLNDDNQTPYGRESASQAQEISDIPRPHLLTLQEKLADQLQMDMELELDDQIVGLELIGNMNESGFLDCDLTYLALLLEREESQLEHVLGRIQRFDPPGICARSLQECLVVQMTLLQEIGQGHDLAERILNEHFDAFSSKHFELLVRDLNVSIDEVRAAFQFIATLNPRPGEGLLKEKENYIIPDLQVERVEKELEDGSVVEEFVVSLIDGTMPTLRISRTYEQMARSPKNVERKVREFVMKKLESARWFLNAIQQRRDTMVRVMRSIVLLQEGFFRYGKDYIKPLILREVAEDIEMDISTISRVTNRKYVQTEWGVYELKYFFSERLVMDSGEDVSTKIIKERLRAVVDAEDKKKPISDQAIANKLKEDGFIVARRTVQKYRELMGIPLKRLRREI